MMSLPAGPKMPSKAGTSYFAVASMSALAASCGVANEVCFAAFEDAGFAVCEFAGAVVCA